MIPTPSPSSPLVRGHLRAVAVLFVAVLLSMVVAGPAAAHPLGNFTTNTSAAILPGPDGVDVAYVLDLAEVPAQQSGRAIEAAGGPEEWAQEECTTVAGAQTLTVDGTAVPLDVATVGISFPPGQAGLDTLRLRCDLTADTDVAAGTSIGYTDDYRTDTLGWREVIAAGDGVDLTDSDVPATSSSTQLRTYPEATVSDVTTATVVVGEGAGDPAAVEALRATDVELVEVASPGGLEGLVERYTELVARQDLTVGFVLVAILLSIVLGTAHAVAPGHGKTVIAAYLLGEGGQARQAVALGSTVAVTHTIGVLVLGVIVSTSTSLAPERLYPILGVMGGVLFTLLGVSLLVRALRNKGHSHDHDHDHSHGHGHRGHDHGAGHLAPVPAQDRVLVTHGPAEPHASPEPATLRPHGHHDHPSSAGHDDDHDHSHAPTPAAGWRSLILPGLAGGMVPSPSALLVLLGGIAIGRAWFGVLLVLAYGIGMALALVGAGYLLHRVRFRVAERLESQTWARVSAALPVITSSLIVAGGLVIIGRSLLGAA